MTQNNYVRTDLAAESPLLEKKQKIGGISILNESKNNFEITSIDILTPEGEEKLNRPIGTYITVCFEKVWLLSDEDKTNLKNTVAEKIKQLIKKHLPSTKNLNVLVAGLGNRYITADAIGPLSVKGITITRHIENSDSKLFQLIGQQSVAAIAPGVLGQTGIETYEFIKSAAVSVDPDVVIVIDALASKSPDRLATTIQICDTGISPGSGIGNKRHAINRETLGVPVIAVGVPTMVSSSTLIYDALEKAKINNISEELLNVLENGKSFFVTLNESDTVVNELANIISSAIDQVFSKR